MTEQPNTSIKKMDGPAVLGIMLTIIGGAIAIGICTWFSHNPNCLWAIILLMWGVERVRSTDREYSWKPAVLGLVMGFAYAAVGIAAYYTQNVNVLWAMILVSWLGDAII